ncbi:hypothetical protein [Motilimonas pumila]|uniref:Lipoprotein n=1 Tax=Motilimonas pumila TaxID=2303987 RepID=A0A418YC01_9GAMM|nr:hypothetical protein [Motilimonas pumila]RJG41992.1 hypothetical protein D1Z90_15260 [Motilimonas pumila]
MKRLRLQHWMLVCLVMVLTACGNQQEELRDKNIQVAKHKVEALGQQLSTGQVRNANILKQYGMMLSQQKPDYASLAEVMVQDATTQGPMYQSLVRRLDNATSSPQNFVSIEEQIDELENIASAADPVLFSDALSDPINVLADVSDGKLARVNSVSKEASIQANGAEDFGAGSQLVGNPSYGQWQTNSSGMSFWAWYGMYSMFSNLTRPVYYDSWSRGRDYSYYNDYGRSRYTSPSQYRQQEQQVARTKKTFGNNKSSFKSPYAKNRTGSTNVSSASRKAQSATSFASRSSYAKKSSSSNRSSSFRTNRNTSSRSPSRGK